MNNNVLKYLLNDDPNKVLSKKGIEVRKFINPLFRKIMMLFTKGNFKVIRKGIVPKDKKIIYAATHGFHDDIIFSMKTANRHVYLLYGSLLDFFKSFHGLGLWVNGVILVDRKNKNSRRASTQKMKRALELGANVIMFPEGTWNKREAMPVQKLYPGIYDVASQTGTLVVPIATLLDEGKGYAIEGDAYDITYISDDMATEILNLQLKKINKVCDLLIYPEKNQIYIKKVLQILIDILLNKNIKNEEYNDLNSRYSTLFVQITNLINRTEIEKLDCETKIKLIDSISSILRLIIDEINSMNEVNNINGDINESILIRSENLLKSAANQKKLYAVNDLRDRLSSLLWEMYPHKDRKSIPNDYWENYIKDQINSTNNLYDHGIEDIAEYKDPNESSDIEVFSTLDFVNLTKENAKILVKTRNK